MDEEEQLFAQEMSGVKRLELDARVALKKQGVDNINIAARREAATARSERRNFLSTGQAGTINRPQSAPVMRKWRQ